MVREAVSTSEIAFQGDISELSCDLALLMMSSEDLNLKQHCEVQEAEELYQVAAILEARARDLRARAQERRSVVTQLDLEVAGTSRQIQTLEEKIRAGWAKHLGLLYRVRSY
ncbi:hypothetical protein LIER_26963 [Lithospermum erythrorhizon]|uniref:Uncharacterized protein n=1 Tax=Lithospermum erythrorhizon TaxID=34254 RepID=A0AAV3RCB2_LITER